MSQTGKLNTERMLIDALFQESLRKKVVGPAEVKEIEKLAGDASTRRYFRVGTTAKDYVVCLDKAQSDKNNFVHMQNIFNKENVNVPRIYDLDLSKGYILEEDLGDITLLKKLSTMNSQKEELKIYEQALEQLLKIHAIDKEKYSKEDFTSLSFDQEKLMQEVDFTIKNLIEGLFDQNIEGKQKKLIRDSYIKICSEVSEQKMVVTHRDYHSRNIMISNSKSIVIDFQDARLGIPQYDLVSLLEDCYYKISRQNKHSLKKAYWDNFLEKKYYQNSFEQFLVLYDKMAMQRTFKALGSFAYIYRLRGDVRYLKYIGYAFEKLRDILFRYQEYNDLRMCLSEIYYEY